MPPSSTLKRKAATSPIRPSPSPKKPHPSHPSSSSSNPDPPIAERLSLIQRAFYPAEIPSSRCAAYISSALPRPLDALTSTLASTASSRARISPGACVIHWFKRDLRLYDNRGLAAAAAKAQSAHIPLICVFLISPQDYQAHLTSPARVDFELRSLAVLRADLAEREIPLVVETVERRREVPDWIVGKCGEWGARHVFCNVEYEVDELRREEGLVRRCVEREGVDFTPVHDDAVVAPGELETGAGKQYSVYSPWFRAWVKRVNERRELLEASEPPGRNPEGVRERFGGLFEGGVPSAPENKRLGEEERERFRKMWPAGEHEAQNRLDWFLKEKVRGYKERRNLPAADATAKLSVHFAAGTLSARTAVRCAHERSGTKRIDAGDESIQGWISEVAWRDFYKHVLAHWPFVCMHKPFKYEYSGIAWSYDEEAFARWCAGTTGFPIVDAAMRQLNYTGYMHNRCRMIVASFLAKDLLLDWRMGEKYFMEHLIDGDFASNNGGWGFSASTGVDPQPYFRIFNPLLQSEKFDPQGEYIRKWIPELKGIKAPAIHDPYDRGHAKEAEKAGYPRRMVEHKVQRGKALEMYKNGLGRSTANVGGGVHN